VLLRGLMRIDGSLALINLAVALFLRENGRFFVHGHLVLINLVVVVSFKAGDLDQMLHDIEKFS